MVNVFRLANDPHPSHNVYSVNFPRAPFCVKVQEYAKDKNVSLTDSEMQHALSYMKQNDNGLDDAKRYVDVQVEWSS